jgi:hypothetical protein
MNLILKRFWFTNLSTIGCLYIDDVFELYTLEDVVREEKIYGETTIPEGRYQVRISYSQRFKRVLPELLEVPNFTGIRIHTGNFPKDTEGCILVGRERGIDCLASSRIAFNEFFPKLQKALKEGEVWVQVRT